MPSLSSDFSGFQSETDRLRSLLLSTHGLAPAHRKVIAEITLLRLSILVENTLLSLCCKLVCGAQYIDGTAPVLLARQPNRTAALTAMKTLNRAAPIPLKWNDGKSIRDALEHTIDAADPIHTQLRNYAAFLTELRFMRNHIAHKNAGTRVNFAKLIMRYYGAKVHGVTVGNLLVSPRVATPPLLESHIVRARVMMRDICRA